MKFEIKSKHEMHIDGESFQIHICSVNGNQIGYKWYDRSGKQWRHATQNIDILKNKIKISKMFERN